MKMLLFLDGFKFDLGENLTNLVNDFFSVIPNLIGAIIVFVIGWLIAKIIARIIKRVLKTIGIDKLGDKLNEIDLVQQSSMTIVPSTLLSKVFYYIILLFVTVAATGVLKVDAVTNLVSDLLAYTPNILVAMVLLAVGLLIADIVKGMVQTACESFNIPSSKLIANVIFFLILIVALISALTQLGIETDFMITVITIILGGIVLAFSIGYGLASKESMSNYLASRQGKDRFQLGNVIKVGDVGGEIIDIDSSSVTILTGDNRTIIIPFWKLSSETVEITRQS